MADLKISQLTSATLPLAGTEVLPIVQSSTTKKVATDDLTVKNIRSNATTGILQVAGPAAASTRTMTVPDANFTAARIDASNSFTSDQTLATGNLIQGTAAKGFNFTANTGAAGMTSQLLNWYEEGTWTPADGSGASLTFSSASGRYTRIGRAVHIICSFTYPSTANVSAAIISGLPFTTATPEGGLFLRYTDLASLAYVFPILTTTINVYTTSGNTVGNNVLSTKRIDLVGTYFV